MSTNRDFTFDFDDANWMREAERRKGTEWPVIEDMVQAMFMKADDAARCRRLLAAKEDADDIAVAHHQEMWERRCDSVSFPADREM